MKLSTSNFKWSTSEQLWPFAKSSLDEPLYCKEIDLGVLPNSTFKDVAHNIPSWSASKLHSIEAFSIGASNIIPIPRSYSGAPVQIDIIVTNTDIEITTFTSAGGNSGIARMIYAK